MLFVYKVHERPFDQTLSVSEPNLLHINARMFHLPSKCKERFQFGVSFESL